MTNNEEQYSQQESTSNEATMSSHQCPPNTFAYTVRQGDTMWLIAQRFGVSLDALIAANPQIPDPSRIQPGQIVCVPTKKPKPTECPPNTFAYTVQPGDTMWLIAQRFGVSLDALIAANPQIPDPSRIQPGQIVCVPTKKPTKCPPNTFAYTVRPGDTMWLIAQRFGVSLDALIAANPQIPDPNRIQPGQIVCVPTKQPTKCPPNTFAYTVRPGDSMWLIAQRFGVSLNALIAANPQIPDPSRIQPGQIVCVPRSSTTSQSSTQSTETTAGRPIHPMQTRARNTASPRTPKSTLVIRPTR